MVLSDKELGKAIARQMAEDICSVQPMKVPDCVVDDFYRSIKSVYGKSSEQLEAEGYVRSSSGFGLLWIKKDEQQ